MRCRLWLPIGPNLGVCLSVIRLKSASLCKNGWTDQDAVCGKHSWGFKEHCIPSTARKGRFDAAFAKLLWLIVSFNTIVVADYPRYKFFHWPWPNDLDIWTWHVLSENISAYPFKNFEILRNKQTNIHIGRCEQTHNHDAARIFEYFYFENSFTWWVSSFLTAHQHIEGHFSAIIHVTAYPNWTESREAQL